MICPGCGFEQARGGSCPQCGTHLEGGEPESGSVRPKAPVSKPAPAKHRSRVLHDLDMTISLPGPPPAAAKTPPPAPEAASAKTATPAPAKPAPESGDAPPPSAPKTGASPSANRPPVPDMLCITASQITGRPILDYLGIVTATVRVSGKALKEPSDGTPADTEMQRGHERALDGLRRECGRLGGNAVVGVTCSPVFEGGGLWLFYSGTAVTVGGE